ncbi:UDP-N-acetylmuramate dehydrogenase [Tepidiphilus baoligensis]|uniref:UDP-N-acetylenolpyruvoylglucosamine reductase n=1 Tax=Tepidiphilus baoligensis TaxID=2698687 RepID=A0ABX1QJK5_9PROT|nr:UDP-N-acetylmuramate dehydrogenase [Tepidiphilus baoligensis]NMH15596.1 UDP-N-acetylmuramate dehydrogenase [Tepidiphilus baoligensis]
MQRFVEVDLSSWTTLGVPVRAQELLVLEDEADIARWLERRKAAPMPELVLGGGSNVVFLEDFAGRVVRLATRGYELVGEEGGARLVRAAGGEPWDGFVRWCVTQGWGGLENLAAIPGSVGAVPVQNVGAYGLEVGERIAWVEGVDRDTGLAWTLSADECGFGYRTSRFKAAEESSRVITAVVFRLPRDEPPRLDYPDLQRWFGGRAQRVSPADVYAAVAEIRARKLPDPRVQGNVGSFFKNPLVSPAVAERLAALHPDLPRHPQPDGRVKLAAGWMIERCGLKGVREGGAMVHERQALVLCNAGGATGADFLALARRVREAVAERFGVELEVEPVLVGREGVRSLERA